uniref:Oxidoreductase n=2 Tax=Podospora anserina (strain S / ATCC MYA-4624 / DSM 980 / FGSC 10383) TaxID=515849 RepID=A0A090D5V9_PODAN|nr:Putative oxidoreductase [Podospora anserina S mat+]
MTLIKASQQPQTPKKEKVLLTGGTGFVASHVLDSLATNGHPVVVTVRSEEKGNRLLQSLSHFGASNQVQYAIVPDISTKNAFDPILHDHRFTYVIHTASPYQLSFADPVNDCLNPAIKGTTYLLDSIHRLCPSVTRVVITSSSAAILNPPNHRDVYDESSWSDVSWEQAMQPEHTYRASKKFAEQAAWSFLEEHNPRFTIATINNTYTFGPLSRSLANSAKFSSAEVNTSNRRIWDLIHGKWRNPDGSACIPSTAPVFTFVDVRDVADAHLAALTAPGQRYYTVGGFFSNYQIARIVDEEFKGVLGDDVLPDLKGQADDFEEDKHWKFDVSRSEKELGIRYRGLRESVRDAVVSMLEFEKGTAFN